MLLPGTQMHIITFLFVCIEAVSYTHLDVYKRQQLNIALELVSVRLKNDNVYIFKLEDGEQEFITSDNPVKLQNLNNQQIRPFDPSNIMKLPLDAKHYLMSVSYTHLDVYKRQAYDLFLDDFLNSAYASFVLIVATRP